MVCVWMMREIILQDSRMFLFAAIEWEIDFNDLNLRKELFHVVAEAYFAVSLLRTGNMSILDLLHQHDFLLVESFHHQHFCCEISTAERVLPIE